MSDENSINNLPEQLNDIVADLEHSQQAHNKREAEQRALEVRRRIEERQEKRRLEQDMADFSFDFDDS
ncbi:MAG: hypothetical protein QGG88_12110 [Gammaproteobacteria bacterium]|jgi:glutamine synthetase type III|nr:hypothetical protein [Gammaproteobacteria bacterium]